jgi:hypothetical protein
MRTLGHQASLFALFALGLAGLMAALCHDAAHGPCFAVCCGLIPGLSAALLVPALTAGVGIVARWSAGSSVACDGSADVPRLTDDSSRHLATVSPCHPVIPSPALQAESCNLQSEIAPSPGLAYCALASWLATIWLSAEVCPLVCARLCGPCSHTNAGMVGFCAFFFGALGLLAGSTIVEAGLRAVSADRQPESGACRQPLVTGDQSPVTSRRPPLVTVSPRRPATLPPCHPSPVTRHHPGSRQCGATPLPSGATAP